jgi:hypothetical protein
MPGTLSPLPTAAPFDEPSRQPDATGDVFEDILHGLPAIEARIQASDSLNPAADHASRSRKEGAAVKDP